LCIETRLPLWVAKVGAEMLDPIEGESFLIMTCWPFKSKRTRGEGKGKEKWGGYKVRKKGGEGREKAEESGCCPLFAEGRKFKRREFSGKYWAYADQMGGGGKFQSGRRET